MRGTTCHARAPPHPAQGPPTMQMPQPTGVAPVSAARLPQREQSPAPFSGRGGPPRPVAKPAEAEPEAEDKSGAASLPKKAISAEADADQGAQSSASGGTVSLGTKRRPAEVPSVSTPTNKRSRTLSSCSSEALALGYELGTIKHAAYVLLTRAGDAGLTVSAIVEHATKEGMYSWGTCKTPNNSVTAALSQDQNFCRVAPSTYALRTHHLRPVGAAAQRESRHASTTSAERGEPRAPSHHNLRSNRERREHSGEGAATSEDSRGNPRGGSGGGDVSGPPHRVPSHLRVDFTERYSRGPLSRSGSYLASPLLSSSRRREQPLPTAGSADYGHPYSSDGFRDDVRGFARSDSLDAAEPRLLPIRERQNGAAAGQDLYQTATSPESPSTPTDVASLRPQYSPSVNNAASCLFLFPVAHPHVPQRPADTPGAPTEAEARADAWREEAAEALKRSGKNLSPPKQMRTQLPPWVFEAIKQEREEGTKEAESETEKPADSGDCAAAGLSGEGEGPALLLAEGGSAEPAQLLAGAAAPEPMVVESSHGSPQAAAVTAGVSMFSPLAQPVLMAGCA